MDATLDTIIDIKRENTTTPIKYLPSETKYEGTPAATKNNNLSDAGPYGFPPRSPNLCPLRTTTHTWAPCGHDWSCVISDWSEGPFF